MSITPYVLPPLCLHVVTLLDRSTTIRLHRQPTSVTSCDSLTTLDSGGHQFRLEHDPASALSLYFMHSFRSLIGTKVMARSCFASPLRTLFFFL